MSVMASTLWLFGGGPIGTAAARAPRVLVPLAIAAIVVYAGVFASTTGTVRPVMGTITGTIILAFLAWTATRARALPLSTPRIGLLVALLTSVSGAVLGILYGLMISSGRRLLPDGGESAHPATMVTGFLLPTGMALAEWRLHPGTTETPADTAGRWQMGTLFAGSVLIAVGLLLDAPPLIGLSLPLEVTAVTLFVRRLGPTLRRTSWTKPSPTRWFAVSTIAIVVNIAYLALLIVRYEGDFDRAPFRLILALDHLMFVGVMTTAVLGLLGAITAGQKHRLAPTDQVVFWSVVIGVVGFVVSLLTDSATLQRLSTPVLGVGLLVAVVTMAVRLQASVAHRRVAMAA